MFELYYIQYTLYSLGLNVCKRKISWFFYGQVLGLDISLRTSKYGLIIHWKSTRNIEMKIRRHIKVQDGNKWQNSYNIIMWTMYNLFTQFMQCDSLPRILCTYLCVQIIS